MNAHFIWYVESWPIRQLITQIAISIERLDYQTIHLTYHRKLKLSRNMIYGWSINNETDKQFSKHIVKMSFFNMYFFMHIMYITDVLALSIKAILNHVNSSTQHAQFYVIILNSFEAGIADPISSFK